MISVLIGTLIFELSHSATIYNDFKLRRELNGMMELFKTAKAEYFQATGKEFTKTDFKESESINLSEMRENGDIKHFNERLRDNDIIVYEEPKRNPIGFMSHSTQQVKETVQPIQHTEVKKPLVGMRLRDALRNGADVYGNKPLDSAIYTQGHGEPLPAHPSKPSLFTRFSQVLDKRPKTPLHASIVSPLASIVSPLASIVSPLASIVLTEQERMEGYTVGKCKHCGVEFKRKSNRALYCKDKCRFDYHNKHNPTVANERSKKHSSK
jgi:hypothetical protein